MTDLLSNAFGVLIVLAGSILLGVLSNEAFEWLPRLTRRIVHAAAMRLRDSEMRERYEEEWQSVVAEMPGSLVAFVHATSLFFSTNNTERAWCAELSKDDVENRFAMLDAAVLGFTDSFRAACERAGLTLAEIAGITKIPVDKLQAMERGQLDRISVGSSLFAYLDDPELRAVLGSDFDRLDEQYRTLFRLEAGLPPAPAPSLEQRRARVWCRLLGHKAYKRHVHRGTASVFHWSYLECERCGRVSRMRAEVCRGRKTTYKLHADAPLEHRFTCDINVGGWPTSKLN